MTSHNQGRDSGASPTAGNLRPPRRHRGACAKRIAQAAKKLI